MGSMKQTRISSTYQGLNKDVSTCSTNYRSRRIGSSTYELPPKSINQSFLLHALHSIGSLPSLTWLFLNEGTPCILRDLLFPETNLSSVRLTNDPTESIDPIPSTEFIELRILEEWESVLRSGLLRTRRWTPR